MYTKFHFTECFNWSILRLYLIGKRSKYERGNTMINLGTLEEIKDLREVWSHEARSEERRVGKECS